MKVLKQFTNAEMAELKQKGIDLGMYYIVPPQKAHFYEPQNLVLQIANPLIHIKDFWLSNRTIAKDLISCGGVLDGTDLKLIPTINGIREFSLGFSQKFVRTTWPWFRENLGIRTQEMLELKWFESNIGKKDYISHGTLLRSDVVIPTNAQPMSCDNNLLPLGIADLVAYGDMLNSPIAGQEYLKELACLPGIGGIVTQRSHPAYLGHKLIASSVYKSFGKPIFVFPANVFTYRRTVNHRKLRQFYSAADPSMLQYIPNKDFVPDFVVRHIREPMDFHTKTFVVADYGQFMLESHLLTGLAFVPGMNRVLQQLNIQADLTAIRETHVPSIVAKRVGDKLYLAKSCVFDRNSYGFEVNWVEAFEGLYLMNALLEGNDLKQKTNWFVKAAASSGKKGVRFSEKAIPGERLIRSIIKESKSIIPENEAFTLQPKVDSVIETGSGPTRAKLEIFLTGENLRLCGLSVMTAPMEKLAVHGASDSKVWMVDI